jgi:hypothetical protein
MSRPDVYVVGAPRCGTTSLYDYLSQHPEVFVPAKKELHYYTRHPLSERVGGPGDRAIASTIVTSENSYLRHYRPASRYLRRADVSPSYLFNHHVSSAIRRDVPGAYIVAILRDPVERAYSQYLHLRRTQQETLSFEKALAAEPRRIADNWSDAWRYVDSSRYAPGVAAYLSEFGAERVHVMFTEELASDPQTVMADLFHFLGVSALSAVRPVWRNSGGEVRSRALARVISRPNRATTTLARTLSQSARTRVSLRLFEANTRAPKPIPETARSTLARAFEQDALELTRLLGRGVPWHASRAF